MYFTRRWIQTSACVRENRKARATPQVCARASHTTSSIFARHAPRFAHARMSPLRFDALLVAAAFVSPALVLAFNVSIAEIVEYTDNCATKIQTRASELVARALKLTAPQFPTRLVTAAARRCRATTRIHTRLSAPAPRPRTIFTSTQTTAPRTRTTCLWTAQPRSRPMTTKHVRFFAAFCRPPKANGAKPTRARGKTPMLRSRTSARRRIPTTSCSSTR